MTDGVRRPRPSEVTRAIGRVRAGHAGAWEQLLELVYDELRATAAGLMRGERRAHTLQPTALVHEAFMRLAGGAGVDFNDRRHFLAVAAQAMRRVLVDHARRRNSDKRGGTWCRVDLDDIPLPGAAPEVSVLDLHRALEELAELNERQARVVELRYFGGMTLEEVAEHLGLTRAQAKGDWTIARAWIHQRLRR